MPGRRRVWCRSLGDSQVFDDKSDWAAVEYDTLEPQASAMRGRAPLARQGAQRHRRVEIDPGWQLGAWSGGRGVVVHLGVRVSVDGRPQPASTMNHLRNTLRAALNLAVKEGVCW